MSDILAYSIEEAARVSRTSRSALYEVIGRGELTVRKRGRKTLVLASDLQSWLNSLPRMVPSNATAGEAAEHEAAA
jgi:excisionase family DNA binding protein